MNVPDHFICPISQDIMKDPVVDPHGISYERAEIVRWLNQNHTDPITRSRPLYVNQLVPNLALKATIEDYLKQNAPSNIGAKKQRTSYNSAPYQILLTPIVESFEDTTIVTLKTNASHDSLPVHIVAVVDVSGSMGDEVEVKTTTGVERNGLSKLDITKHALNTIINSLSEHDVMTLITFSTNAKLLAENVQVDQIGKTRLLNLVKNMQPDCQTNIWDGLLVALKCIERSIQSNKSTSIFLLTDGIPNIQPNRGHEHALSEQLAKMTQKCTINTFGFGYQLDSTLLKNLSTLGGGLYSFIPDAGFVGTVFINALANQFLTCVIKPNIIVKYTDGTTSLHELGSCKIGIDRSVFIKRTKQIEKLTITYTNALSQEESTLEFVPSGIEVENEYDIVNDESVDTGVSNLTLTQPNKFYTLQADQHVEKILNEGVRDDIIRLINKVLTFGVCQQSNNDINTFISNYMDHMINQYIKNVVDDATGQIRIALSNQDYYEKWGKHYLLSLAMSHSLQNCSNFKDKGLQLYSNQLLEINRTNLDQIFLSIPAPIPSAKRSSNSNKYTSVNMSSYNNSNAPCFSGDCTVQTIDGFVKVKDIRVGDRILSSSKNFVEVTHIIKTTQQNSSKVIVFPDGLIITPGHPVFVDGEWILPENVCGTFEDSSYKRDLYDFCVNVDHIININGIQCVTLGHNLTGNSLIEHEYLGSQNVMRDIEHIGRIQQTPNMATIRPRDVMRDQNGHIIAFTLWVD